MHVHRRTNAHTQGHTPTGTRTEDAAERARMLLESPGEGVQGGGAGSRSGRTEQRRLGWTGMKGPV